MINIKKILTLLLLGVISLFFVACNNTNNLPTGDNVGSFSSYEQLKDYLEELNGDYTKANILGGEMYADSVAMDEESQNNYESNTRDYSKTNNQVEGVEEADRILTDGYHIYIASGNQFYIVNADTLDIEFTYSIDNGTFDGLYIYNGRVVLISYEYTYTEYDECIYYYDDSVIYDEPEIDSDETDIVTNPDDEVITTTEDTKESSDTETRTKVCINWTYTYGTHIRIFDISDMDNVTMNRELYFDSSYLIDTRMIDQQLYLVLNNYMMNYGLSDELFVPSYLDSAVSNDIMKMPIDKIYYMPNNGESYGYLILASLDVANDSQEADVKTYLGSTYRIYMSENNLYTTIYRWEYDETDESYSHYTDILRFEIVDGKLEYKALAEVDGSPLNQFSMDEYNGVFRIATTGYFYSNYEATITNQVYLLDATTVGEMEQISVLGGLGKPNEQIFSVRYSGDIAYVVTFEQSDPLYKLDLSDPHNPVVLGELYEEGVSDYLHEITDNLLIGIGRQSETIDGWTRFTGVKVSLYDTSEDTPVVLDNYLVEGDYSYTNVIYDQKAFLSFTPQGQDFTYVGIPVFEYYDDYSAYSQSLYLFKVYHSGSLEFVTKLTNMQEDEEGYYSYFDSIERAVIIDNYVYTLSYSSIHMFDMSDNFSLVNSQELNSNYYSYWGYPIAEDTELG